MGLDGVELLMAVEDRFGITIEDEQAGQVATAGDLHELVMSKLTPSGPGSCLSSHVFYGLRRGLLEVTEVSRERVTPGASLEGLLPDEGRRGVWDSLGECSGWRLPPLRLPPALESSMLTGCLGAIAVALLGGGLGLMPGPIAWTLGLAAFPALLSAYRLAAPLAVRLPRELATVGDAARAVLSLNFALLSEECRSWNEGEVWQALQSVVVDQLGCKPEDVRRSAHLVHDLGLD